MNNERRVLLRKAIALIYEAEKLVESVRDDEQDSMDNIPENLQGSVLYDTMEDAVDSLESALDAIDTARDEIENAM